MNKLERHNILELVALGRSLSRGQYAHAELEGANLRGADLQGADLRYANLARADLRGAQLSGARLSRANLSGASLSRSDLCQADLEKADLSNADLSRTSFQDATLVAADLRCTCLEGANLRSANLSGADLSRANLCRTDLTRADLRYCRFYEVDLTGAILDEVKIYGAAGCATRGGGLTCRSLDISRDGDGSLRWLDEPAEFFGDSVQHNLRIEVQARLDHKIHAILSLLYLQLSQQYPHLQLKPPLIKAQSGRTLLTFQCEPQVDLLACARVACVPFARASQIDWAQISQVVEGSGSNSSEGLLCLPNSMHERLDLFFESVGHLFGSTQLPPFFNAEVYLEMFWGSSWRTLFAAPGLPPRISQPDVWHWLNCRGLG